MESATGEISRTMPLMRSSGLDSGQTMTSGCSLLDVAIREGGLGDVEDGVLVTRSGELHDHLAGIDVLTRLGADGGDHTVELGLELRVAELVAGQVEIGLGRSEPSLGGTQIAQHRVVGRLWRPAVRQELRLARLITSGFDEHGVGRCDLSFGRTQAVLKVLRVERRQRVPLSDRRSDVDPAGEHLARDSER